MLVLGPGKFCSRRISGGVGVFVQPFEVDFWSGRLPLGLGAKSRAVRHVPPSR